MDDGEIHEKRFVVLGVSDESICCVINSKIGAFIRARAHLLKCQVAMPVADHSFMSHDSYVDCSHLRTFRTDRVLSDLLRNPDWMLGKVTKGLRGEIVSALKFAVTLSPAEVAHVCAELDSLAE